MPDFSSAIEWIFIVCFVLAVFSVCVLYGVSASSIEDPETEQKPETEQVQNKYKTVQDMRDEFDGDSK